jgi:hypothetical protein
MLLLNSEQWKQKVNGAKWVDGETLAFLEVFILYYSFIVI